MRQIASQRSTYVIPSSSTSLLASSSSSLSALVQSSSIPPLPPSLQKLASFSVRHTRGGDVMINNTSSSGHATSDASHVNMQSTIHGNNDGGPQGMTPNAGDDNLRPVRFGDGADSGAARSHPLLPSLPITLLRMKIAGHAASLPPSTFTPSSTYISQQQNQQLTHQYQEQQQRLQQQFQERMRRQHVERSHAQQREQ